MGVVAIDDDNLIKEVEDEPNKKKHHHLKNIKFTLGLMKSIPWISQNLKIKDVL